MAGPDPLLFARPDGRPIVFLMAGVREREQVKAEVEELGGVVALHASPSTSEHLIRLSVRTEMPISRSYDMFRHDYIKDCVSAGHILPNLKDYKVVTQTPSPHGDYDPVEVMLGRLAWSEVPSSGDQVSDMEDVEEDEVAVRAAAEYKAFKSRKKVYTDEERREIVAALAERGAWNEVKGTSIWRQLERRQLCRGDRTWQSMKEHFIKVIGPKVADYGLGRREVALCRAGLGLPTGLGLNQISETGEGSSDSSPGPSSRYPALLAGGRRRSKGATSRPQRRGPPASSPSPSPERGRRVGLGARGRRRKAERRSPESAGAEGWLGAGGSGTSAAAGTATTDEEGGAVEPEQLLEQTVAPPDLRLPRGSEDSQARRVRRLLPLDSTDMFAETPPRPVVQAAGPPPEVPDTEEFLSGLGASGLTSTQVEDPADSPGGDDGQHFDDQEEDTADPVAEMEEAETPQRRSALRRRGGAEAEGGGRLRLSEDELSLGETAGEKTTEKSKVSSPAGTMVTVATTATPPPPKKARRTTAATTAGEGSRRGLRSSSRQSSTSPRPSAEGQEEQEAVEGGPQTPRGGARPLGATPRRRPAGRKDRGGPRLLGVGSSKENKVVVVLQGLPSDLDSEVEVVRTGREAGAGARPDHAPAAVGAVAAPARRKVQLVMVKKDAKDRRMFRQPYNREEERAVIDFLLQRGGYSLIKGIRLWRDMEEAAVCPGRSQLSLKNQFLNNISKRLHEFNVTEDQLRAADDGRVRVESYRSDNESAGEGTSGRGFRAQANYYTAGEDEALLKFIVDNSRYEDVGGTALWQLMVDREVVPGRTWQSLKERFKKNIMKRLDAFEVTAEQRLRLQRAGEQDRGKGGRRSNSGSVSS